MLWLLFLWISFVLSLIHVVVSIAGPDIGADNTGVNKHDPAFNGHRALLEEMDF